MTTVNLFVTCLVDLVRPSAGESRRSRAAAGRPRGARTRRVRRAADSRPGTRASPTRPAGSRRRRSTRSPRPTGRSWGSRARASRRSITSGPSCSEPMSPATAAPSTSRAGSASSARFSRPMPARPQRAPDARPVAFHCSCHQRRELGEAAAGPDAARCAAGTSRTRRSPQDELCCGFGGTFSVKFPKVSGAMGLDKARSVVESGARRARLGRPRLSPARPGVRRRRGHRPDRDHARRVPRPRGVSGMSGPVFARRLGPRRAHRRGARASAARRDAGGGAAYGARLAGERRARAIPTGPSAWPAPGASGIDAIGRMDELLDRFEGRLRANGGTARAREDRGGRDERGARDRRAGAERRSWRRASRWSRRRSASTRRSSTPGSARSRPISASGSASSRASARRTCSRRSCTWTATRSPTCSSAEAGELIGGRPRDDGRLGALAPARDVPRRGHRHLGRQLPGRRDRDRRSCSRTRATAVSSPRSRAVTWSWSGIEKLVERLSDAAFLVEQLALAAIGRELPELRLVDRRAGPRRRRRPRGARGRGRRRRSPGARGHARTRTCSRASAADPASTRARSTRRSAATPTARSTRARSARCSRRC